MPPVGPDDPGAFRLSAPGKVQELLDAAGFDDIVVEPIDIVFEAPGLDAWWEVVRDVSSSMRPVIDALAPADTYRLRDAVDAHWQPYVRADGSVALPGRALGVAASA
jgi:hypothetical protein